MIPILKNKEQLLRSLEETQDSRLKANKLKETNPVLLDGKPPPEKHELLRKRYTDKKDAQNRYQILQDSLGNMTSEERKEALIELSNLKRQCILIE